MTRQQGRQAATLRANMARRRGFGVQPQQAVFPLRVYRAYATELLAVFRHTTRKPRLARLAYFPCFVSTRLKQHQSHVYIVPVVLCDAEVSSGYLK